MTKYDMLMNDYTVSEFAEFFADMLDDPYATHLPWSRYVMEVCAECDIDNDGDVPCEVRECYMADPAKMIEDWLLSEV